MSTTDLWTSLLSDDPDELDDALAAVAADDVATEIARRDIFAADDDWDDAPCAACGLERPYHEPECRERQPTTRVAEPGERIGVVNLSNDELNALAAAGLDRLTRDGRQVSVAEGQAAEVASWVRAAVVEASEEDAEALERLADDIARSVERTEESYRIQAAELRSEAGPWFAGRQDRIELLPGEPPLEDGYVRLRHGTMHPDRFELHSGQFFATGSQTGYGYAWEPGQPDGAVVPVDVPLRNLLAPSRNTPMPHARAAHDPGGLARARRAASGAHWVFDTPSGEVAALTEEAFTGAVVHAPIPAGRIRAHLDAELSGRVSRPVAEVQHLDDAPCGACGSERLGHEPECPQRLAERAGEVGLDPAGMREVLASDSDWDGQFAWDIDYAEHGSGDGYYDVDDMRVSYHRDRGPEQRPSDAGLGL